MTILLLHVELQSPSDDSIATLGVDQPEEQGGVTEATADQAMEPDNYEDIAKHNIIQVGGTVGLLGFSNQLKRKMSCQSGLYTCNWARIQFNT